MERRRSGKPEWNNDLVTNTRPDWNSDPAPLEDTAAPASLYPSNARSHTGAKSGRRAQRMPADQDGQGEEQAQGRRGLGTRSAEDRAARGVKPPWVGVDDAEESGGAGGVPGMAERLAVVRSRGGRRPRPVSGTSLNRVDEGGRQGGGRGGEGIVGGGAAGAAGGDRKAVVAGSAKGLRECPACGKCFASDIFEKVVARCVMGACVCVCVCVCAFSCARACAPARGLAWIRVAAHASFHRGIPACTGVHACVVRSSVRAQ